MNIGQISQNTTLDQILAAIPAVADITTLLTNTNAILTDMRDVLSSIDAKLDVLGTTSACGDDLLSVLCQISQDIVPPTVTGGTGAVGGIAGLIGGLTELLGGTNPVTVSRETPCGDTLDFILESGAWISSGSAWIAPMLLPSTQLGLTSNDVTSQDFGATSVIFGEFGRMCAVAAAIDTNLETFGIAWFDGSWFHIDTSEQASNNPGEQFYCAPVDFATSVAFYATTYAGAPPAMRLYVAKP